MSRRLAILASMVLAASIGSAASALHAQPKPAQACFRSEDWSGWKASPDSRTIYLRVGINDIYRLDLTSACNTLRDPDARLITHIRGSDLICSPLDLDLQVAEGPPPGIEEPCIVKGLSKLTLEEAAALPKGSRP